MSDRIKLLLLLEFVVLCLLLPSIIISFRLAGVMLFFLWGAGIYCWLAIHHNRENFLRDVWKWDAVTFANMKIIVVRWLIACVGMLLFLYYYAPERMFEMVLHKPGFLPYLMVAYPVLSAFPQELIFCSFFFERYAVFFRTERVKIVASALVFAYAHILFINWVAPFLTLIAGVIFAMTFSKTRSLALVTIEHALYGNALFLIGLGRYFYGGAVPLH